MKVVAVTGCSGFIGVSLTRACLQRGWKVWGIDKQTYAARCRASEEFLAFRKSYSSSPEADIATMDHLFEVDHRLQFWRLKRTSITVSWTSKRFSTRTSWGQNILELVRAKPQYEMPVLVQLSTDEVYGDLTAGNHRESDPLRPSNPYSASKAAADMAYSRLAENARRALHYRRPTNNYGIDQYPEKQ